MLTTLTDDIHATQEVLAIVRNQHLTPGFIQLDLRIRSLAGETALSWIIDSANSHLSQTKRSIKELRRAMLSAIHRPPSTICAVTNRVTGFLTYP